VTSDFPASLRELARAQAGVITGKQAFGAGMTRAALLWQLRSSRWQQLHRGVYALFSGEPGREAVLWAAVLRAGPDAMLSHQTAAELARLTDGPSGALHLTLPASRRLRPVPELVIHTSVRLAVTAAGGLSRRLRISRARRGCSVSLRLARDAHWRPLCG
jgi:hypothetical protein